jgi:cytochrome c-type biogenesis protein CcmH/NrfF
MTVVPSIRSKWMTVVVLVPLALAFDSDAPRVRSLAAKMRCNCGCGDVLAECSHAECKTRDPLKQEIATALQQGKSDEQVLEGMGARYGATILLTPPFRGFDMLLWIVPIAGGVLAVGVFTWRGLTRKR